jgi:hypothetical protein
VSEIQGLDNNTARDAWIDFQANALISLDLERSSGPVHLLSLPGAIIAVLLVVMTVGAASDLLPPVAEREWQRLAA